MEHMPTRTEIHAPPHDHTSDDEGDVLGAPPSACQPRSIPLKLTSTSRLSGVEMSVAFIIARLPFLSISVQRFITVDADGLHHEPLKVKCVEDIRDFP